MENLSRYQAGVQTRWASPENPSAKPGQGATANSGRKGKASSRVAAGETLILAEELSGVSGSIRRIWITISDRSPRMLRSLRLDFYWDGASTPAVSAPLGDFFGLGLGRSVAFHSALFSNPEGRSFNVALPMPFRSGMRLTVTNESDIPLDHLFYDVDYTVGDKHADDMLYFHAHFRRENPTTVQQDYQILPTITGQGRFIGVNIGVQADKARYNDLWWGEGEVKIYIDDQIAPDSLPTLCGTGTEDFIGTAWGQGAYAHPYQGCPVADFANMTYCFYRYHIPDPIFFSEGIRVTIQQIGGASKQQQIWLRERIAADGDPVFASGLGLVPADLSDSAPVFVMYEREDDWSSCAYFYLDRPENDLPSLMDVTERTKDL